MEKTNGKSKLSQTRGYTIGNYSIKLSGKIILPTTRGILQQTSHMHLRLFKLSIEDIHRSHDEYSNRSSNLEEEGGSVTNIKASPYVLLIHVYKAEVFASKVASRVCVCAREPHPVYRSSLSCSLFLFSFFPL